MMKSTCTPGVKSAFKKHRISPCFRRTHMSSELPACGVCVCDQGVRAENVSTLSSCWSAGPAVYHGVGLRGRKKRELHLLYWYSYVLGYTDDAYMLRSSPEWR